MRKISTTLFFVSLVISSWAQNGQIMNGGFENWTLGPLYETPDQWKSSNTQEWQGSALTLKTSDAQHLTSAVRLENNVAGTDSLFGYIILGDVTPAGDFKGIPYTSPFNAFNGHWKGSMQPLDSSYIIVVKFFMGTPYPPSVGFLTGNAATYTPFSVAVTAGPCDSVFVGITSSNPFTNAHYNANSYIQIDNISFGNTGPAPMPLPNQSFETWNTVYVMEADNWSTLNSAVANLSTSFAAPTTDAHTGFSAAALTTRYIAPFGDTIPGMISNGTLNVNSSSLFVPIAYNASPLTFTGYYKYAPSGTDMAEINVVFLQMGSIIGGYQLQINSAAATYTLASGPVNLVGIPDSMMIFVQAGENAGSELKIDDFSLTGGNVGIQQLANALGFKTYPNPTSGIINVEWETAAEGNLTMEITDMSGRVVYTRPLYAGAGKNYQTIDVSHLPQGAYGYKVFGSDVNLTGKIIKE